MLWRITRMLLVVLVVVGWSGGAARSQSQVSNINAPVGSAITYQGWLQHDGETVEGVCDLRFALFDGADNGAQVGSTLERLNHTVTGGYFTVSDLDFGATFTGAARWIEVAVRCPAGSGDFTTLTPRQPLTPAPYALYAINNWALLGNAGTNATNNFVGTTDAVTLTFKVSDTVALRLLPNATSPNIIGGIVANQVISGVVGAVIGGGGEMQGGFASPNRVTDDYGVIGGGSNNQAGDGAGTTSDRSHAFVGGGRNNSATGEVSTIGGGQANAATALYAFVGGGVENNALADGATVSGGAENNATGDHATISGGIENAASAQNATVGGGQANVATALYATVGGGGGNQATASTATIGGGNGNEASASQATVSGGLANIASGQSSFIGGGALNEAQEQYTTISGGTQNVAASQYATIGGGFQNQATLDSTTVSGGSFNIASGSDATVSGGTENQASGSTSTIGGGRFNEATAPSATIAGGGDNHATAALATIPGGADAHASHHGEWAYAAGGFANNEMGEAQSSLYVLRGTTTNNGLEILTLDDGAERLTIASGRTVTFDIQIAARSTTGEAAGYSARGVIENDGGTTAIIGGNPAVSVLGQNDMTWEVTVSADDTNDSLQIEVKGGAGDSIRWVATVRTTEVQN